MSSNQTITIRPATAADGPALTRLAALDSAATPFGRVLLAAVDGKPRAALELREGKVVADPFAHTAELVELLRLHAARVAPESPHRERVPSLRGALRLAA